MFCIACERETRLIPCEHCAQDPLLDGRYRLEAIVGPGVTGITWTGTLAGEAIAIEELPLLDGEVQPVRQRMDQEFPLLMRLSHQGIPRHRARVPRSAHSHSIVAGGLLEIS